MSKDTWQGYAKHLDMRLDDITARVIIACKFMERIRGEIEGNHGKYDGRMTPNIQSVLDILTVPKKVFDEQLEKIPDEFHPEKRDYEYLLKNW